MRRKRAPSPTDPEYRTLDPELQSVLEDVGPTRYAKETGRFFGPDGKFRKRPRPRYAEM